MGISLHGQHRKLRTSTASISLFVTWGLRLPVLRAAPLLVCSHDDANTATPFICKPSPGASDFCNRIYDNLGGHLVLSPAPLLLLKLWNPMEVPRLVEARMPSTEWALLSRWRQVCGRKCLAGALEPHCICKPRSSELALHQTSP